jgi:truncated hemoglobin YjbI
MRDGRWRFAHDKLREGVLREIPHAERPAWHRQAAEALETMYPDDTAHHAILLEHWHQAGKLEKELFYADKVAAFMVRVTAEYDSVHKLISRTLDKLPPP